MRMEQKLVSALHEHPGAVDRRSEHALRYALGFSQLSTFQPGAALRGARNERPDITIRHPELARFRNLMLEHFSPILLHTPNSQRRLEKAVFALGRLRHRLVEARTAVLEAHLNDFSAEELDLEVGQKTLVSVESAQV